MAATSNPEQRCSGRTLPQSAEGLELTTDTTSSTAPDGQKSSRHPDSQFVEVKWARELITALSNRSDNDMYHHVNNSVYAFLIDSIINAYLIERCGQDPPTSRQIGLVVSSYCDFWGSVAYPAVLDLGLRVLELGNSSVKYEVGVFERGKEDVKAVGGFVHVFVEQKDRKPCRDGMEEGIRRGLMRLLEKGDARL